MKQFIVEQFLEAGASFSALSVEPLNETRTVVCHPPGVTILSVLSLLSR